MGYLDNNLPLGAKEDSNAPWNQNPEKEIEVLISITLSKTVKIYTSDYIAKSYIDEDGNYAEDLDLSNTDLKSIVEEQIDLPAKDWNIDEFEVILE